MFRLVQSMIYMCKLKYVSLCMGSHVMQYGDIPISDESLSFYVGFDLANANATFENSLPRYLTDKNPTFINQHDADLLHLWKKVGKQNKCDSFCYLVRLCKTCSCQTRFGVQNALWTSSVTSFFVLKHSSSIF